LLVPRMGIDQVQASAGRDVQQASGKRHIFGKGTTRPLLPCDSGRTRHEGRSQQGERRKGKGGKWALVAHRRQRMSSDEVVLPLLHVLARREAFAITTAR